MATTQPKSGVTEYTITTGTGPLTLTGASPGFRQFVSTDDGKTYHYGIFQAGTTFETGIGTYTHSSRQLSRTTIVANINGTTTPLNLGAGTKEVSITLPGERSAMLDCEGQWSADQYFNGKRLYLDAAQTSWLEMAFPGLLRLYIASVLVWESTGGLANFTLLATDDTATEAPELLLRRDSATPTAGDALGVLRFTGRDSAGAAQSAFKMRPTWSSVTSGSHSSTIDLQIANAGALQSCMQLRPAGVTIPSGINLFTAGKTTTSPTTIGAELFNDGSIAGTTNNTTPLFIARNGSDGEMIQLLRGASVVSSVTVSGGVVTWATFTGGHWTEWAPGEEDDEQLGTIVSAAPGLLAVPSEQLPLVRLAVANDPAVYGVIRARVMTGYGCEVGTEQALLLIDGLGTSRIRCIGPIVRGDLLKVSATSGVADAQVDDIVHSTTIAKATQDSPDTGERLVPCVLMAG